MAKLRIAFVTTGLGVVDNLSLPVVGAVVRARAHEAQLFTFQGRGDKAQRALAAYAPDIVAYSVCSNEAQRYLTINRALKERLSFFALFGGPHPTYNPSFVQEEGVDAICRGEGDRALGAFLDRFGSEAMYAVDNFAFRLPGGRGFRENPLGDLIADLDSLPFPARDMVYAKSPFQAQSPIKAFMASRGCPYNCAHCFNSAYNRLYRGKGAIVRTKSVGYLVAEIQEVARRYPLTFVRFHDDIFGSDMGWLEEFAARFPQEVGLPFTCYVRPTIASEEYVAQLKRAGCHAVCMAIECGNERLRNEVLRRHVSNDQIAAAAERFRNRGIRLVSFSMLGVPGETEEDLWETIRINRRLRIDFADASVFQPYPQTDAFTYCLEHGYVTEETKTFENIYGECTLNVDPAFRRQVYLLHKLFTLLVDRPKATRLLKYLPDTPWLNGLLSVFHRLYFGYFLHRRIYASRAPWGVRLRGAAALLFSLNRT